MSEPTSPLFPGPLLRRLKSHGQLLEPTLWIGKAGLSEEFCKTLEEQLGSKELVKVKFVAFKEQKKALSTLLAEKTGSRLVMRVGNVAVLYRPANDPQARRFEQKGEPPPPGR